MAHHRVTHTTDGVVGVHGDDFLIGVLELERLLLGHGTGSGKARLDNEVVRENLRLEGDHVEGVSDDERLCFLLRFPVRIEVLLIVLRWALRDEVKSGFGYPCDICVVHSILFHVVLCKIIYAKITN